MASHVTRRLFSSTTVRRMATDQNLKAESKRNPETLILGGVMVAALGGAGYYFGRNPTSSTSESSVRITSAPWESGATTGKYRYQPGGDPNAEPRDAPSAVNSVVVPGVTLTQEFHDKYNKFGKDGYP